MLPNACLAFVDHEMEHGVISCQLLAAGLGKVGGSVLEPHFAIVAACM